MKRGSAKTKTGGATKARTPVPAGQRRDEQSAESAAEDRAVDEIVRRGPSGTFVLAGIATALVVAIYFGFYLFIYLPRGAVQ
jgi:hypothetical protein